MPQQAPETETTLRITRTIASPRDQVFRARTEPDSLKRWWGVSEDFSTPIAEVDLRVGGAYRLGMLAPGEANPFVVGGVYREVSPPEKLVYTWVWEGGESPADAAQSAHAAGFQEMLITVEFRDLGGSTEVVLTHEFFPDPHAKDEHNQGWMGCLGQLARLLENTPS
jgi:uncharacterized protein YndB with AHSA1/START domain